MRKLPILAALALFLLHGCSRAETPAAGTDFEVAELRYQGSPGNVIYPELAEDLGFLAPLKLQHVGDTISGPQDVQSTVTGDTDFSLAFNGAIAKMVAGRAPVRSVVGVYNVDDVTWNAIFVLDDSPIKSPRDFIGKKVAMNTLGAHSEFVLREYLSRGGLSADEIKQVTLVVVPPVNAEQSLRNGQVDAAHFLWLTRDKALERGGLRKVISDFDLFGRFNAASYVMSERFMKEKPRAARKFVDAVARAVEWGRATPREQVIERLRKIMVARKRNETDGLLKHWHAAAAHTQGGLLTDRDFGIWIDWLIKDGQLARGQVEPAGVYTNQFNPFHH